jgi:hypothetical protein
MCAQGSVSQCASAPVCACMCVHMAQGSAAARLTESAGTAVWMQSLGEACAVRLCPPQLSDGESLASLLSDQQFFNCSKIYTATLTL